MRQENVSAPPAGNLLRESNLFLEACHTGAQFEQLTMERRRELGACCLGMAKGVPLSAATLRPLGKYCLYCALLFPAIEKCDATIGFVKKQAEMIEHARSPEYARRIRVFGKNNRNSLQNESFNDHRQGMPIADDLMARDTAHRNAFAGFQVNPEHISIG